MKKIVALLLTVMLLFGISDSIAENTDSKKITFRGIPWGSSIEDTLNILKKEFGDGISVDIEFDEKGFKYAKGTHYFSGPMIKCSLSIPNIKVAGYGIANYTTGAKRDFLGNKDSDYTVISFYSQNNIVLYFQPILVDDGTDYSHDEGMLWRADYIAFVPIVNGDGKSMENELIEKLDGLYSEHTVSENKSNFYVWNKDYTIKDSETVYQRIYEWNDENTFVNCIEIKAGYHERDVASVTISYSTMSEEIKSVNDRIIRINATRAREEAEKQRQMEEENKENRGTDGL